jgi:hypothetical protein
MSSNELADRLMAVIDAEPNQSEDSHDKTVALTECIARILVMHLHDDPVTARQIASCLTQRLLARIAEGGINRNEFLN